MKVFISILLTISTLATGGLCLNYYLTRDAQAPQIIVPAEEVTYEEGSDSSLLLAGVQAKDNVDGDISSNVRIYDIAVLEDGKTAQIIYAVYDSSYNLGKSYRLVKYVAE